MPPIPTNLVTGFLGVGKTTSVIDLLKQKPPGSNWAVLVNEYGEVSIDDALIEGSAPDGVTVREIGGGCVCCASAPYLPVALHFLLLDARPERLIIETTGLGHPSRLLDTLRSNYPDRLELRASLCIVDPADFAKPPMRENPVFLDQIQLADVLVMNKLDTASPELVAQFQQWADGLFPPKLLIAGTTQGRLDPAWLDLTANAERLPLYPEAHGRPSPPGPKRPSPPGPLSPRERGSEAVADSSASATTPNSFTPSPPGRGGRGVRASSEHLSELAGRHRKIPEELLRRARELRQDQTTAEQFLWDCVRNRQLMGAKFRRQHNVGPYIADFYCHEARLCIELDGEIHDTPEQRVKDAARDEWLRQNGFESVRFRNDEILNEPLRALELISDILSRTLPAGAVEPGIPRRYPSPPGVKPACCGWIFSVADRFDEAKLLRLFGVSQGITRLKGVFRLPDEWVMVNRAGTDLTVAPTSYRRDSRLEVFAEDLDWGSFEGELLGCLVPARSP
jgi:G3E family GTPase/very-short-patch-repair endonuclease